MLTTNLFTHRYVPARVPGPRERVMIVLHGLGDSLNGYHFLPEALRIPELSYLLVNAPDSYYGGYSWYDFQGDRTPGVVRSRGLLLALLDELVAGGVAARDIYLFGFSQGCLMVTDVALRCGHALGGVVGVSGYVAFPEEYPAAFSPAAAAQKILVTHGRHDPMVPYEPAKKQFLELQRLGIALEFASYEKDHTMLMEELEDIAAWLRSRLGAVDGENR
jgi:phospholipase/carboxylesterase